MARTIDVDSTTESLLGEVLAGGTVLETHGPLESVGDRHGSVSKRNQREKLHRGGERKKWANQPKPNHDECNHQKESNTAAYTTKHTHDKHTTQ